MGKAIWHRIRLVAYTLRAIGVLAMIKGAVRWIADRELRAVDSGFDARFGTDTNAALTPAEAAIPVDRRRGAVMYLPSMDRDLAAMVAALEWPTERLRAS